MRRHLDPIRKVRRNGRLLFEIVFWYADPQGRRRRYRRLASVQTATAARAEAQRLAELAARTGSPYARAALPTFGRFVDETYVTVYMVRLRPGTQERYLGILRQGVRDHFGRMQLDAIDALTVRRYAAELRERGVDPRGHCNFVRSVIRAAVEAGLLHEMPKLPTFPQPDKLPHGPSMEEARALIGAAHGWLRTAVALAVYAGLRQGEVRAIQAGDVDLADGVLYVRRAFSGRDLVPPKGDKERAIPLVPELALVLRDATRTRLPGAFLVVTRLGTTPSRQAVLSALKSLERRSGLPDRSFHMLRHCFCSGLVRRGANLEAVRSLAGHSRLSTTERYVHATDVDRRAAIARLAGD